MNYLIRELKQDENKVLDTFLYEAIFIPEGVSAPPKDIINQPDLQVYVKDFGKNKGDLCLVAQVRDKIVGAVWVRIMNDYGHIDNETPSFAISLLKEYRNYGIGTELMKQMLTKLKLEGYKQASLSVQKMNYAVRMYRKIGFEIVESSPNLCVHSSSSYVSPSMLPLSSGDLIEWSLVCHSTLSYQKFCDRHSNHYDHPEELHQSVE